MNSAPLRHAAALACVAIVALCTTAAQAESAADVPADQALITALPPIESIGPGSDIRCFLAPGVPVELTRAALRRAWVVDPAIHDFVGLSEDPQDVDRRSKDRLGSERQISHWDPH